MEARNRKPHWGLHTMHVDHITIKKILHLRLLISALRVRKEEAPLLQLKGDLIYENDHSELHEGNTPNTIKKLSF